LWIFGKKVLLPVGRARFDYNPFAFVVGMTKEQAEALPEFSDRMARYDYEEQVRGISHSVTLVQPLQLL